MLPLAILAPLSGAWSGILRTTQRPKWLSVSTVAASVAQVLAIAVLVAVGGKSRAGSHVLTGWAGSSATVGATRTLSYAVGTAVVGVVALKWWRTRSRPPRNKPLQARLLGFSLAMLLSAGFNVVVAQLDVLILGIARGSRVNALYQPVSLLAAAVTTIPGLIGAFFLPVIARLAVARQTDTVRSVYHWAERWSVVLCAPILAILIVCPKAVNAVLYNHPYDSLTTPTRILGLAATITIAFGLNGLTLDAYGQVWLVTRRVIIALVVSTVACLVLVPLYGMVGAATATLIGLATSNALCSAELWWRYRILPANRAGAITFTAFAGSVVLCLVLDAGAIHAYLAQCISTAFIVGLATLAASTVTSGWREWTWFFHPGERAVRES
jgi:O-antigen/teichoic acid export membrane protein